MSATTSTTQLLQEFFILATGRAASNADIAQVEALVGNDGDLTQINALIDLKVGAKAQQLGVVGMVQAIAKNGLGVVLSDAQAASAVQQLMAAGINSWSKLFTWLEAHEGAIGSTLDNRGEASVYFTDLLASSGKSDLFAGASVSTAVSTLLQNITDSTTSLGNAQQGFDALAANLTANGISSAVIDGYVRGATVYVDANGDGVLNAGEWSTTTSADGSYVLPLNITAGSIVAFGGTDILTNLAFQGVLTAPTGSTVVNPFTTLVQAMLDSGQAGTVAEATTAIKLALGLPGNINLLSYDPLAVLDDATASASAQQSALGVQALMLQVANVMTQVGNAINTAAANGTGTLQSASAAVSIALGSALGSATGVIDLGSSAILAAIIQDAAALEAGSTGGTQLTTTQVNQIATVTAASNMAAIAATTPSELAKVAVVTQGGATTAIINGTTAGNNLSNALENFTGANLQQAIAAAQPGEVPGAPAPTPTPEPGPTFVVSDTSGVVSFAGTATGDIDIAIAGNVGTFTRGGVVATLTVPAIDANTINLALGQTLALTAAEVVLRGTAPLTGAGTYKITDTVSIATLNGIVRDNSVLVTFPRAQDIAANLDDANDSAYESTAVPVTVTNAATIATLAQVDQLWGAVTPTTISDTVAHLLADSTFVTGSVAVTVTDTSASAADLLTLAGRTSGALTFPNLGTLQATASANISALNGGAAFATTLDATTVAAINVTLTAAQHNGFTTISANGTDDTLTLSDAGTLTTNAAIRTYSVVGGSTVTVGATADHRAQVIRETGTGVTTFSLGTGSYSGVWEGIDSDDIIKVVAGTELLLNTGLDGGVVIDLQNGTGSFHFNPLQIANVTFINTGGSEGINVFGAATFNAAAGIETYDIQGASVITVLAGTNVNGTPTGNQTVNVGGLTVFGSYGLGVGGNDVIVAANGANIAGVNSGAATTAETLDISSTAAITITMTAAQHNAFTAINANANNDTIRLSDAGTITADADIGTYVLAAGTTNNVTTTAALTVDATALTDTQVLTLAGSHAVTVNLTAGDLTSTSSGAITVTATTGSNVIVTGTGNDTITGGTGVDSLTGGAGNDTFVFASGHTGSIVAQADTIQDFTTGADKISTGIAGTVSTYTEVDGLSMDFDSFKTSADAAFNGTLAIFAAYDFEGSTNALVAIDANASGTLDAGDTLLVLVGVSTAPGIGAADFV